MNSERHFKIFGYYYLHDNIYDKGAADEEKKMIRQHKRYDTNLRTGAKKCPCKETAEGLKCEERFDRDGNNKLLKTPANGCINKTFNYECMPSCENNGGTCMNQDLQRFRATTTIGPVYVKNAGKKGLGLFAAQQLPANYLIGEYLGVVRCHEKGQVDVDSHYAFGIGSEFRAKVDLLIDSYRYGNHLRMCNHSCDPNCSTQETIVGTRFHIPIRTNRTVEKDEELTISYGEGYFQFELECECGAENCISKRGGSDS